MSDQSPEKKGRGLDSTGNSKSILAIVPAYGVADFVVQVVREALKFVDHVLVVDDGCPEESGKLASESFRKNGRVTVVFNEENLGVGGAMKTGFRWALERDFDVIVKIDGDGQMDPSFVPKLTEPIMSGKAEFSKGNRFGSPRSVRSMPFIRLIGNSGLSLLSKISTGYWSVSDPTNGFIAIRKETLEDIEFELLSDSYFFEMDLLFRLSISRARIHETYMASTYGTEKSNLGIFKVSLTFPFLLAQNAVKRVAYNYYIRDWTKGSIELPAGIALMVWGVLFGIGAFSEAQGKAESVTAGQAVAMAIGIILGFQLLLSFLSQDVQSEPRADR